MIILTIDPVNLVVQSNEPRGPRRLAWLNVEAGQSPSGELP